MALQGNLSDIGMTDLFQLIGSGKKNGTLHIEGNGQSGYVCFQEGRVYFAISNWNRESLGARLVKSGKVTEKQLKQALGLHKIQKKDKAYRRLGQIMVDEDYINKKLLEDFVREQIYDTLFDLMRWDSGEFCFEAGEEHDEEDVGIYVSVENIIMEAARRLEVWKTIREKLPNFDEIFRKAMRPNEDKFEVHLEPREWKLLRFINGRENINRLIEASGFNDFETSKILYGLYSAGLIEKIEDNPGDIKKKKKIQKFADELAIENSQDEPEEKVIEEKPVPKKENKPTPKEEPEENLELAEDIEITKDPSIDKEIVELVLEALEDY